MGKSLRGKECGKGICQRKDGLYYARFVDKTGKRHEKYLPTLPEARNYYQYALILKIGLTWDAIDFQNRTLTVNKTLEYPTSSTFGAQDLRKRSTATAQYR